MHRCTRYRLCACVRACPRVSAGVRGCPRVFACVRACPRMSVYVRVCPRVSTCVRVCPRMSARVRGCPRVFACVHVCSRVTAGVHVCPRPATRSCDRRQWSLFHTLVPVYLLRKLMRLSAVEVGFWALRRSTIHTRHAPHESGKMTSDSCASRLFKASIPFYFLTLQIFET